MRYFVAFGTLAVASGWLAFLANSVEWLLPCGYLTLSFAALAGLYLLRPDLNRIKASAGPFRLFVILAFGPYFLLAKCVLFLQARIHPHSGFVVVTPGLVLGRVPFGFDDEVLEKLGVEAIVDVTWEFRERPSTLHGRDYLAIPVLDGATPTLEQIQMAVQWVGVDPGRVILVHCALGNSRSATVVSALLLERGLVRSATEAIQYLRDRRPSVGLNQEQMTSVEAYCSLIRGDGKHRT